MRRNGSSFSTPLKVEGTKQTSKIKASAHFSSLYLTVDKSPSRLESPARRFRPETRHRLRALRFSDTRKLNCERPVGREAEAGEGARRARGSDRQQRSAPQKAMATAATAASGPLGGGSAVTAAAGAVAAAAGGQSGQFQLQFQRLLQRQRLQWHPAVVAVVALWRCIPQPSGLPIVPNLDVLTDGFSCYRQRRSHHVARIGHSVQPARVASSLDVNAATAVARSAVCCILVPPPSARASCEQSLRSMPSSQS